MIPRKTPLKKKRSTKRAHKSPRCQVLRCGKKAEVFWLDPMRDGVYQVVSETFMVDGTESRESFGMRVENGVPSVKLMVPFGKDQLMCKSHAKAEADRRFSVFIRERDGECKIPAEGIPCNGGLQCCHLLSRRFHATRWSEDNAVAGCAGHHAYWTRNPDRWSAYLEDWLTPRTNGLASLRGRAFNGEPADLAEVLVKYPKVL